MTDTIHNPSGLRSHHLAEAIADRSEPELAGRIWRGKTERVRVRLAREADRAGELVVIDATHDVTGTLVLTVHNPV